MGKLKGLTVAGFVVDFHQHTAPVEFGRQPQHFLQIFLNCYMPSGFAPLIVQSHCPIDSLSFKGALPQRLARELRVGRGGRIGQVQHANARVYFRPAGNSER